MGSLTSLPLRRKNGKKAFKKAIIAVSLCAAFSTIPAALALAPENAPASNKAPRPPAESPKPAPALSAELQQAIDKNVERVRSMMPSVADIPFDYGEASIEWLDGYIDRMRGELGNDHGRLSDVLASYIGESIRRKYGGRWVETEDGIGVEIRPGFIAFPYNKVSKQFANGSEDSVFSFYESIQVLLEEQDAPTP